MTPATQTALLAIGLGVYLFIVPGYLGRTLSMDDDTRHSVEVHGKRKVQRRFMMIGVFLVLVGIALLILY